MHEAKVSGPALAAHLGIKPQGLTNMRRKPNASMSAQLIAHAAAFLRCDLYWLCTGEGGEYVPRKDHTRLAREVAEWLDEMSDDERWKAYGMVIQMRRGFWPTFTENGAPPGSLPDR